MVNVNKEKFTRAELADMYEKIILFYEVTNGLQNISLSTRAKGYRKLKDEMKLEVKRFENLHELVAAELPLFDFSHNFIWFYDKNNNSLKSIFYFLRNSAAHAHIKRCKSHQWWYHIEHRYNEKVKFVCSMKKPDFWRFVAEAKKFKTSNKGKL